MRLRRGAARLAALIAAAVAGTEAVRADFTVANDDFELASHPTGSRTVIASPGTGIQFFTRNATGTQFNASIVTDATFGSKVLSHVDTSTTSGDNAIIGLLPQPVSLANVGDSITLNFSYRFTNVSSATGGVGAFRFGLENSNGTTVTGDNQGTTSDNDFGYYMSSGVKSTPTVGNALYNETGGTLPIGGGTDRVSISTSGLLTQANTSDNNIHTVSFTLTRATGTSLTLSLLYDNGTAITGTSNVGIHTVFDEIFFNDGFLATPVQFELDNIVVTAPEPGMVGLLFLPLATLLRRRRARSRR